ncbi:extracellular solute-binding protein [Pelagibius litoralis]|uniref:Extracellular solute-binding protein n=1 Tax=Pelagibius litoralis TaxID=374515 RepID=A0A967KC91_9PROT|nr:extracellular solute-binding protein [Pelagibius litoralis]NIA69540.1 extracellular solute-binding protein [Pelagibius litoralis]
MTQSNHPEGRNRFSLPRRKLLKGAGAMTAAAALNMPIASRVFGKEPHPLAGKKIDMSILGIAGWLPSSLGVKMSPLFNEYVKEKYGYEVEFAFAEAPFSDLFQKAATSLATRSQEYNIIISDSQWIGALAEPGWILQLNDIIAQNQSLQLDWYSQTVVDTYMIYPDGTKNIWGLPQEGDTIALFLRKDMLQDPAEAAAFEKKYGAKLPQTFEDFEDLTMAEFEKVADHFNRPDDQIWGTAMQYSRVYDFVTCYLYPFMFSQGGEVWDAATAQVEGILNSDINAKAMEQMKSWLKYQPPGAVNYGIAEQIDVFTQGKVFSCFQWAAVGLAMITEEMKDKVMVVAPPKHGTGADARRVYTMGGQPWVINAYNDQEKMRVAIDFMNWWYQPETTLEFARRGGNPCDKPTLTRSDFDSINPWNQAYKFMLEPGRSRDFWHHPKYAEMLAVQQEAFTSYMTGQTSDPMQALTYAACQQQQILVDAGSATIDPTRACITANL